jgi:hypothetical protein
VNNPPSFTAGPVVTVAEDSGAYSAAWASNITSGPGESDPLGFIVNCNSSALFAMAPRLSVAGVLSFTPAADVSGSTICLVT